MPKGPNGEKRPADVIGSAIMVGRIATGEIEEVPLSKGGRVKSGLAGAAARASKLTALQRNEIAKKAANARWRDK
ncbi:MAG: RNA-binding protein [Alphaproteobacteria bacterium]|nr:RNA-binding protein [Alphaproteobacteria bacterium]